LEYDAVGADIRLLTFRVIFLPTFWG